jgi:RHS repeat-associated protein
MIGQVKANSSIFTRHYYLKDHLGSIRMTVNSSGDVVGYDDYYPFDKIMPYRSSVASADNRYRFTSKERDFETNYDYFGARYYDSKIGRWLQVDPMKDIYPGWSPYNYCLNNPHIFIDANGDGVNLGDVQTLEAVRMSLKPEDRKLLTNTGIIDPVVLTKSKSTEANFLALKELVNSKIVYEVLSAKGFSYKDENGNILIACDNIATYNASNNLFLQQRHKQVLGEKAP